MDNPNYRNPAAPNINRPMPPKEDLDKPIIIEDLDKPLAPPSGAAGPRNAAAPSSAAGAKANVSHAPLNLGGPPAAAPAAAPPAAPAAGPAATPAAAQVHAPRGPAPRPVARPDSSNRITGVKTFFTKLHPGALEFLDEQISSWLKENPGISIKQTNVATGEVQAKKTEPNILITVWY